MNEPVKKTTTSNSVTPKYAPVKCVVCEGWGSFSHGKTPCKACDSKGYILVEAIKETSIKENQNGGGVL